MTKKILIIVAVLSVVSFFYVLDARKAKIPNYEKIANQITLDTAKEIKEKYPLYAIGMGGAMMDNVKKMHLSLRSLETLTIEKGRRLAVSCIDTYLDNINSNESVRPFLLNYPFTENNIELKIFIYGQGDDELMVGRLAVISIHDGEIYYRGVESEYHNKTILKESYEEAKMIVNGEYGNRRD